jgi:hypothetical protein
MRFHSLVLGLLVFTAPMALTETVEKDNGAPCIGLTQEHEFTAAVEVVMDAPGELLYMRVPVIQVPTCEQELVATAPDLVHHVVEAPYLWRFRPPGHWLC